MFTRIGAADNLARGRSTFMVEMTETAVILNTATARSLIVLDEIGRGTSTYDGLALAWAVVEHIHRNIRAKTLFATHYHELTELAEQLEGVRNLHVSVKESGDQILFLRRVEPGAADRSYGIEVARLAALPMSVIERAREILAHHESDRSPKNLPRRCAPVQIRCSSRSITQLADRIRNLNLDIFAPSKRCNFSPNCRQELKTLRVAGIMSGTSLDGIDVAIVDIQKEQGRNPSPSTPRPIPKPCAKLCSRVSNSMTHTATIARLNFLLGELYAEALDRNLPPRAIPLDSIELIGMHGQTIFHEGAPVEYLGRRVASTLQIGEAAVVAERTGFRDHLEFSRARHRRRRAGRAAGSLRRLPLVPPSRASDESR